MIRDLTVEDVPAIIALARVMSEEAGPLLHAERTSYILSSILGLDTVFAQGDVREDGCRSMLIGEISEHPFLNAVFAQELVIYTHPDYRGGIGAVKLIKSFTSWAEEKNVDYIKLEATAGINNDRTSKLFSRLGYNSAGFLAFYPVRGELWQQHQL
mgnify:FL=1|tara:strand:+ start:680 stop:1147 length:468 start_codon:yes stop_codon:yes gene_type:complete